MHKTGKHIAKLAKKRQRNIPMTGQVPRTSDVKAWVAQTVISEANVTLDGCSINGRARDPLRFKYDSGWKNSPRRQSLYTA